MRISEFIEGSNAAKSVEDLFQLLERACSPYGFDRLAYGVLTNHVIYRSQSIEAPAVALNYPDDWVKHYFANRYQEIDPIVVHSPSMRRPFAWNRLHELVELTPVQRRFMMESAEAGLNDGLTVPLHGPFGNVAVVCAASSIGNPEGEVHSGQFAAIAAQFHNAYSDLVLGLRPLTAPQITERERECLLWSARGKSSWDIGQIISIS